MISGWPVIGIVVGYFLVLLAVILWFRAAAYRQPENPLEMVDRPLSDPKIRDALTRFLQTHRINGHALIQDGVVYRAPDPGERVVLASTVAMAFDQARSAHPNAVNSDLYFMVNQQPRLLNLTVLDLERIAAMLEMDE